MIDPGSLPGQTASLDFGEQSQFNRERQSIASAGRPAQPPQGGPPQPGPAGPAPVAGGGAPVQPAGAPPQRTPLTAADLQPGGPVFSQPQLAPRRGWQDEMRTWARHPSAGPWLGAVNRTLQQGGSTAPVPGRGLTRTAGAPQPPPQ